MANKPIDVLISYEQKIIDALVNSLEKNNKIAGGNLAQSVSVQFKAFATHFVVEISMEKYWRWVDEGRKKGGKMPPLDSMLKHIAVRGEWHASKVKQIQREYKDKKGIHKRKKPLEASEARKQLAFLIGRSIKKKGIKPTNFVEEALEGNVFDQLTNDMAEALGREITITLDLNSK